MKIAKFVAGFLIFDLFLNLPVLALESNVLSYEQKTNAIGEAPGESIPYSPAISNYVGETIDENTYKLGPGDQIAISIIIGDNDRSVENLFSIGPDGKIYYPKIGEIYLSGLEITKAKALIDHKIKQVFKGRYNFSLRLLQPRVIQLYLSGSDNKPVFAEKKDFVYIYGEVAKSGRFEYLPGKKFSDYISYAGGPTGRASLYAVTVTRTGKKYSIDGGDVLFNGNLRADMEIMAGDVINVPSQFFYFSDFSSFSSLLFTMLAFYNTFIKK